MEKFKKIFLLVFAFALAFSAPAMNIAQASSSKLDLIADKSVKVEEKFQLDERFIKPENPTENVRVIVELEGAPAIENATKKGVRYKDLSVVERDRIEGKVEKEQKTLQSEIKEEVSSINFIESFTTVFNGFSAEVLAKDVESIAKLDGVKAVYESTEYTRPEVKPEMVYSKELVQAQQVWNNYKYKGEGMIVGVIDTGIDPYHRDMVLTNSKNVALTKEFVDEKLADGTIANGQYFSPKVPFGYNYMDGNNEILDLGPTASYHGMHVSGTIGANGNEESGGIKGIAPEAQLLALKVFGNDPGFESTFGDIYVKAIDDAIKLGADVLNLSLGSVAGFVDSENPEQKAVQNATENGILVSISAGNSDMFNSGQPLSADNQDYGVTGSPSVSESSLGVASIENSNITSYGFDYFIEGERVGSGLYLLSNDADPRELLKGRQVVSFGGFGTEAEFNKEEVKGKVALVSRGNGVNFVDKGLNAQKLGATAVIVYNNAIGTINMASDAQIVIPYMSALKDDGDIMAAALKEGKKVEVEFKGTVTTVANQAAGTMSTFTSWGPTPNLDFKPEITAPGGNIFSTLDNNEYGLMSGTSMAAPHVSGGSALLLQRVDSEFGLEGKARVQLARTLLMNTSIPVEMVEGVYESPRRQGAGLMQIANAIETDVYVQDKATGEPKVALKEIKDNKFKLTLDVTNVSDEEKTYDVNLQLQSDVPLNTGSGFVTYSDYYESYVYVEGTDENADYSAKYDSKITIPANSTKTLTIDVDITASTWLYEAFKNGYFVDGFVTLTDSTDSNVPLVVPFFGYNGEWDKAPIFDSFRWEDSSVYPYTSLIDEEGYFVTGGGTYDDKRFGFSPNGDGVQDAVMPLFSLTRNAKELKVEVTDEKGKVLRTLGSLFDLTKNYSATSPYKFNESLMWDGKINGKKASDGQYVIQLRAKIDFEGADWQTIKFPVKIDTVAPTADIKFNEKTATLTFSNVKDNEEGTGYYYASILVNGKERGTVSNEKTYKLDGIKNKDVITVEVYDAAGNFTTKEFRTAVPETDKPVIYIESPEYLDGFDTKEVTVTGKVEDASPIRSVTVNGETATLNGSEFSHTLTLEDGVHDIRVEAIDEFSNKMQISRKIIVDTTPATITVKENQSITTLEKATVAVNVQDNFDEVAVFVNESEVYKKELSTPYGMKGFNEDISFEVELELGKNTFELLVKDSVGNTTTETITITRKNENDPDPQPEPEKGNIDASVEELIQKGDDIVVSLDELKEGNKAVANLSTKTLKTLVESKKAITLEVNNSTVTIPAAVLAQISSSVKGDGIINVSINLEEAFKTADGKELSNVIDLSITSTVGEEVTTISQFNEKVVVSVSLPKEVKDSDKVAAYHIDEKTGALTYVQSKVVDDKVVFKTNHFSKFVALEQNVTFKDLGTHKWASKFIESLASKTIIKGKATDRFAPGDQITREEFAVLLVRALGISTTSYEGIFSDVKENSWSALEVEAANRAGIVLGNEGKFNPKQKISREQMVTMIVRALKYDSPSALDGVKSDVTYKDANTISKYAVENVGLATNLGIINGISSKEGVVFAPKKNANRAEASKMIYLLLENLK